MRAKSRQSLPRKHWHVMDLSPEHRMDWPEALEALIKIGDYRLERCPDGFGVRADDPVGFTPRGVIVRRQNTGLSSSSRWMAEEHRHQLGVSLSSRWNGDEQRYQLSMYIERPKENLAFAIEVRDLLARVGVRPLANDLERLVDLMEGRDPRPLERCGKG